MSRKSKYSAEQKLTILNKLTRSNISEVAKKYAVGKKTIRTWGYLYKYQGIDGLRSTNNNHRYSKEFKLSLVQQYQKYSGSRPKASKADKALLILYDNLIPVITALEPQYCHYTNGPLEGINRKIKQIQRTAYGYRNFEHLKARIYLQTYLGKDTRSSVKTA